MPLASSHKCLFCFHELKPENVCFENMDDTVEPSKDEIKLRFKQLQNPTVQEYDVEAMTRQPIRSFAEGDRSDFLVDADSGYPVFWHQPMGDGGFTRPNPRRICGFCHMPLPQKFGKCPNVMIGFCGNSGSGKTVYMLSLLHDLMRVDGMSVTWDSALGPDREVIAGSINYREAFEAMYNGKDGAFRLPAATDPNMVLPPLVLDCMYKNREFMLTAYDMAGEGMRQQFYMARMATFLMHCDGVVYLKDPDYLPGFEKYEIRINEHEFLENVFDMISAGSRERGGRTAHIALTMTKIDMILDRYGSHPEFRDIVGHMFDHDAATLYNEGFDVARAMMYNRFMQKLYEWPNTADQTILNLYRRQMTGGQQTGQKNRGFFSRLFGGGGRDPEPSENVLQRAMLFGVSPLGRSANPHPDANSRFMVVDRAPVGLYNADPVLWLLHCCGLFPATEN